MNKLLIGLVLVLVVGVGGFYALNTYIYNAEQGEGGMPELASYFQERMITLGVEDIGQPIEGFDAQLLMLAFPGLVPIDFGGVETFEGHYEVRGGEAVFVRDAPQPVSSAESTISDVGYATLLEQASARLSFPTMTEADVDALINALNTGERISAGIEQSASALGVTVTPREVLEDSRCPVDVTCIQAGTVRLRATLESGLGSAEQEFTLGEPVTTEVEEVTLVQVDPAPLSTESVGPQDYVFYFEIKKR